jgi:hypothetical protein
MDENTKIDNILKAAGKHDAEAGQEEYVNSDAVDSINNQIEKIEDYEDRTIEAGALGAARGLSFGLSDQALTKSGIYTPEELSEVKKRNEIASLVGEIGTTAAVILGTGGAGAAAKGLTAAGKGINAASKAGLIAEKAFVSMLAKEGKNSIARQIVKKAAPKMLGSAVEGAIYGTGQLISEEALGNAEISAENVVAYAGTGALFGGATSGIFQAAKALVPVGKKLGKAAASKISQEPKEAFKKYLGLSPNEATKLNRRNPKFLDEGVEWLAKKDEFGKFTSDKKILESITEIKNKTGDKIGAIYDKAEDFLNSKIATRITNQTIPKQNSAFARLAKNLDDNYVQKFEGNPLKKADLRKARSLRDNYLELAKSNKPLSIKDLLKTRKLVDDDLFKKNKSLSFDVQSDILKDTRKILNEEIQNGITNIAKLDETGQLNGLVKELVDANKEYSYSSTFIDFMTKKVEKESQKSGIGLRDLLLGASAAAFDPSTAALVVGGKKLLESDFRRRATILATIEKQNRAVDKKISSGIKDFFGAKASNALESSSSKALIHSNLSIPLGDKKKKPRNKKEAFKNVSDNITELISNPEKLNETITRRTLQMSNIAPQTTAFATATATKGLQFLDSKLPKPSANTSSSQLFTKREFEPSELQMSKFERYVQAVENPMSAVDDLKNGTLTREAAEAVKIVYPNMFAKMQQQVIETIQDPDTTIDYSKRLQLGILMDLPTDASLQPENIASLQSNLMFQEQNQPSSATAAKAENLDMAGREDTKANKIAQK